MGSSETGIAGTLHYHVLFIVPRTMAADVNQLLEELRGFLWAGDDDLPKKFIEN